MYFAVTILVYQAYDQFVTLRYRNEISLCRVESYLLESCTLTNWGIIEYGKVSI